MKSNLSDTQTKHIMQGIQQELTVGKKAEAVRLFMEAQSKHLLPRDGDTLQWLVEKIGNDFTNKLLDALVHYPCFYCKKGLQPCEACDGAGHLDHETICDQCLAVGLVGCSFCGATGWSPYESVPTGLRYIVFAGRAKIAEEQIKTILAKRILAP